MASGLLTSCGMSEHDTRDFVIPINAIPAIYSYCNRWCERCRFRARCTTFVNAHPDSPEARSVVPAPDVSPSPEVQAFIDDPDLNREPTDAEMAAFVREHEARRRRVDEEPAVRLAEAYATAAAVALGELGPATGSEPAEVVRWHLYFIPIKVRRALGGIHDEWFDPQDLESDACGSAKAALVAMDDVMAAWLTLGESGRGVQEIHEAVSLLSRAREALESVLPRAREFLRPGFDSDPDQHADRLEE